MKPGQLRIVGGEWRSRRLSFKAATGLRPTSDRMRETLFNWLMHDTFGKHTLDAFAGSGALGLEALSRGASHCDFIERAKPAAKQITQHLATLNCSAAKVHNLDALTFLKSYKGKPYELAFIDPPFNMDLIEPTLGALQPHLADGAFLYVEAEQGHATPEGFEVIKHKAHGQVESWLLRYHV
ncbi:16S rRNA (guanine(966)-N(2))-methyltransferase RsmD [Salinibius halmophilus]|uniref:16S rRNA (guanine(966)-N(2))-methyltransferase RsmD n=1 Tax=Salinibius halmophilus TaxID=1853216 RepID=UPI000E667501|nr:16S rRNA (guanine(966)-N(2))-methyltransferase RsmD [Salinibius halmophilus]